MNNKEDPPDKSYENLQFLHSPEARTIRILSEYIEPLSRLRKNKVNNTVLFFGSSQVNPNDKNSPLIKYYWEAEELAYQLARWAIQLKPKGKNFVICTGGGPGLMEAANRGASRAGGKSMGMNISLPHEQKPNPYISPELSFVFHYFFMRKFWLAYKAKAIIAFPGGFGTLDEVLEILTLRQTHKFQEPVMIILYGKEFWEKVLNFNSLLKYGCIDEQDKNLFHYCSNPQETFSLLKKNLTRFL
ncbi:TIGR00730 family Rossman fold protein [bacterium]|nr:TIGR00730 family Rossman fold protein [bacterium]